MPVGVALRTERTDCVIHCASSVGDGFCLPAAGVRACRESLIRATRDWQRIHVVHLNRDRADPNSASSQPRNQELKAA